MAIIIRTFLLFVFVVTSFQSKFSSSSILGNCWTVPEERQCNAEEENRRFFFFFNASVGICQSFNGCLLLDENNENVFETIEMCIVACDFFGSGDRMFVNNARRPDLECLAGAKVIAQDDRSVDVSKSSKPLLLIGEGVALIDIQRDENGWTLLHHAGNSCNVAVILELIQRHNASLHVAANDGSTPLHLAAKNNCSEAFSRILELDDRTKIVNARDKCGYSAAHFASAVGSVPILDLLQRSGADFQAKSVTGRLPLHYAPSIEVARFLLGQVKNPTIRRQNVKAADVFGRTPFFYSSNWPDRSFQLSTFLLRFGAAKTQLDIFGLSPLLLAIARNDLPFLEYLFKGVGKTSVQSLAGLKIGRTVAHLAARFNSVSSLKSLLNKIKKSDINLTATDWLGQDPYCVAISNGHNEMVRFLLDEKSITASNCFERFTNALGFQKNHSALVDAVAEQQVDVVRFLTTIGAPVSTQTSLGRNAFHEAAFHCSPTNEKIIRILLSSREIADEGTRKAVIEAKDSSDVRPIEAAIQRNCPETVTALVESYNGSCSVRNSQGLTPLLLAKHLQFVSLFKLMVSSGKCTVDQNEFCGNSSNILCLEHPEIRNGNIEVKSRCPQSQANIRCDTGFQLTGEMFATCQSNGHWQIDALCRDFSLESLYRSSFGSNENHEQTSGSGDGCADSVYIENGQLSASISTGILTITCDGGYELQGSDVITCNSDGKWSINGFCSKSIMCSNSSSLFANGKISPEVANAGEVGSVSCDIGYRLQGPDFVRCSEQGDWVIDSICAEVLPCLDAVMQIPNGKVADGSSKAGALRNIICNTGYGLNGTRKVKCEDGVWKGTSTCVQVRQLLALPEAAKQNNIEEIKRLLEDNADVRTKTPDGYTALVWSGRTGNTEALAVLLDFGADINLRADSNGRSALTEAAYYGHEQAVRLLIAEEAGLNLEDHHGFTPLLRAIERKHVTVALILINSGADINRKSNLEYSPLHFAILNNLPDIVIALIKRRADLNTVNKQYNTPLIFAAIHKQSDLLKLLVDAGVSLNNRNSLGNTALHYAAQYGLVDDIQSLVQHSVDLNVKNNDDWTALHYAIAKNETDAVSLLLKAGCYVNVKNKDNNNELHISATNNNPLDLVKMLLDHKVDVNAPNNEGSTPLHLAVARQLSDTAKLLLSAGAKAFVPNHKGEEVRYGPGGELQIAKRW